MDGVIYVAYGRNARDEAQRSIQSLRRRHDWPVSVIGEPVDGADSHIEFEEAPGGRAGRWAKVNLYRLSPYDRTLFLDADTRVHGDLTFGFDALANGWDLVMVPSAWQMRPLHNVPDYERRVTLAEIGDQTPVMLNTGVMYWRKNGRTRRLWEAWREEWLRYTLADQGAFIRALYKNPVLMLLLGRAYNGGEVIEHLFGRAAA